MLDQNQHTPCSGKINSGNNTFASINHHSSDNSLSKTTVEKKKSLAQKPSIYGLSPEEISSEMSALGEKSFRTKQLASWIYEKKEFDPSKWSNLPQKVKLHFSEKFSSQLPEIVSRLDAEDGATKLLLKTESGQLTETVILRYKNRVSLCVSSQVGCKLACTFCQTGKLGFFRNLSSDEIVSQFALASQIIATENKHISHMVFMGMGEPLDNYEAVINAVNLFTSEHAYGMNPNYVTISTSGIAPKIVKMAEDTKAVLAVSLHLANDKERTALMPINRRYDLTELKKSLLLWQEKTGKKLTFEYILIDEVTSTKRHAKALVKFLHGFRAKVNLIPFNSHPGMEFQRPSDDTIREFQKYLSDRSYAAPVRYSKGLEVSGACGQLAAKKVNELSEAPRRKAVVEIN